MASKPKLTAKEKEAIEQEKAQAEADRADAEHRARITRLLLDTPPVGVLVDAVALAKYCDGALLVVGYRKGRQQEIGDAVQNIRQTGCKVLGAVLNDVRFKKLSNRHYYYSSKRYAGYYKKKYGRRAAGRKKGENGSAD